jgi:threonine dehydrogenase-like Zn-dependent dehydrogenase
MAALPDMHRSLVLTSFDEPLAVKTLPTPNLLSGSAIVQILSVPILSYASKLYSGAMQYPLHLPLTVGGGAIGRVLSVSSDATSIAPGQLVLVDPMIRGRDDPTKSILLGVHGGISEGAARLMAGDWRDGSCAEFARWPLENVHALDERKLVQEQGYTFHELAYLVRLLVPLGGLSELDVRAGERVVIAPATGQFGGAAVEVALAMGADVVICGRNSAVLENMKATLDPVYPPGKIDIVQLSGDVDADVKELTRNGACDKYIDFSPAAAAQSTHIMACLMALRKGGKACFQGGIPGPVNVPYLLVMFNDLQICGKFMYERQGVKDLIRLVEAGRLKFDVSTVQAFGLEEWEKAFDVASRKTAWREVSVFDPSKKSFVSVETQ